MNVETESALWHIFLRYVDAASERAQTEEEVDEVQLAYEAMGIEIVDAR